MRKKFDLEWKDAIDVLSTHDAQILTTQVIDYQTHGIEPTEFTNPVAEAIFILIKPTIDRRRRASEAARRRRQHARANVAHTSAAEINEDPTLSTDISVADASITAGSITDHIPDTATPISHHASTQYNAQPCSKVPKRRRNKRERKHRR